MRSRELATCLAAAVPVARHDRGGGRVGIDDEDLGTELGEDVRHHEARRSERVVEDELELRRRRSRRHPGRAVPHRIDESGRVVLESTPGEADVADVGCERPSELLAVVEALDPSLRGLVDVEPRLVEEPDARPTARRAAARRTVTPPIDDADLHLVARHRNGRGLEVVDVHARGVAADHDRPLRAPGPLSRCHATP